MRLVPVLDKMDQRLHHAFESAEALIEFEKLVPNVKGSRRN
jgi:hypothetical protein